MQKKPISWGLIALMFALFFPVGIFLLVKKLTGEKLNYLENGKALKIIGWVLIGAGMICVAAALSGEMKYDDGTVAVGGPVAAGLVYVGIGVSALLTALRYIKKGTKFQRYVTIVNATKELRVDRIAAAYPVAYEVAAEDLQDMLNAGYFMGAYLDLQKGMLVMPMAREQAPVRCVTCQCCGAANKLTAGAANVCEYCGMPL